MRQRLRERQAAETLAMSVYCVGLSEIRTPLHRATDPVIERSSCHSAARWPREKGG